MQEMKPDRNKIGIIGKGKMGTDIFNYLLNFHELALTWICRSESDLAYMNKNIDRQLRKMKLSVTDDAVIEKRKASLLASSDINDLRHCGLVLETINDEADKKDALMVSLNAVLGPQTVIASNTSSIPLAILFKNYQYQKSTIGLHFFYPSAFRNIVEINCYQPTAPETKGIIMDFCRQIDRRYLVLNEADNFSLNKMLSPLLSTAYLFKHKYHISVASIDSIIKECLISFGVFELVDSVGIDIILTSVKNYFPDYRQNALLMPWVQEMEKMIGEGYIGSKVKKGFYQYYEDVTEASNEQKEAIANTFTALYINTFLIESEKGYCSKDELNEIFIEFFGAKKSPLEIVETADSAVLTECLSALYQEYRNDFYCPHHTMRKVGAIQPH